MIDFIKVNISHISEHDLLNNDKIKWVYNVDQNTGELLYPIRGEYYNLRFKINPTRKELSGSLHQFYNIIYKDVKTNHDDFYIDHIRQVLTFLIAEIADTIKGNIENLEFGLNILTKIEPTEIIDNHIICFDNIEPSRNSNFTGKGKMKVFERAAYRFKIYDKGRQMNLSENILRIEIHYERGTDLKKHGIQTLSDLTDKGVLDRLFKDFMKKINRLTMIDPVSHQWLDKSEKSLYKDAINSKTYSSFKGKRVQRQRFKKKVELLSIKHNLNTVRNEILIDLFNKGKSLLECYDLNDLQNTNKLRSEPYIHIHNVTSRQCIVTQLDISHQKTGSRFTSELSIKKIESNDPDQYKRLKKLFGPTKLVNIERINYHIAHNIRNSQSNLDRDVRRKIATYSNSLFPLIESEINEMIKSIKQLRTSRRTDQLTKVT